MLPFRLIACPGLLVAVFAAAAPASAQETPLEKLTSYDWRERNAAARTLCADDGVASAKLFAVMQSDWDDGIQATFGWNTAIGAGPMTREPRTATLRAARELISYVGVRSKPELLTSPEQLTVPWHPHDLAEWLVRRRGKQGAIDGLQPTSIEHARVWLTCNQPDEGAIAKALADEATAKPIAKAMWQLDEGFPDFLLEQLANGPRIARHVVLDLTIDHDTLQPQHIEAIVEQFLHDDDEYHSKRAGGHLLKLGTRAAEALIPHLAIENDRPDAMAILCLLRESATPALEAIVGCLDEDPTSQRRALIGLSDHPVPPELQKVAAPKVYDLLRNARTRAVRILAMDALATMPAAVTDEMKRELQGLLDERKFRSARARLIGCMRQLGCLPELSTEKLVQYVRVGYPNSTSWMAVADRGVEAEDALAECISKYIPTVDDDKVGEAILASAPELLVKWLDSEDLSLRARGLATLTTHRPDLLPTDRLLELFADESLCGEAFDAVCAKKDAKQLLPRILATCGKQDVEMYAKRAAKLLALKPSLEMVLQHLEAKLKDGECWTLARGIDDATLKKYARQWIQECDDPVQRDDLLGEFLLMGLDQAVDIQMVEAALRSEHRGQCLIRLRWLDTIPRELIPALEAVCTDPVDRDEYRYARESLQIANR